ncbi:Nonribosomal peptide synthase apmB [Dissostichus eleginoides]|uniref:Nonribosomal peptide synthase apmB n=1 Tax=Dissostichus eleginoides TaxID=100907 RepID=A0AAD9FI18_DISEL|nr:Nonribosomal peptide synthase apmB [Dissostichus eleginoides]
MFRREEGGGPDRRRRTGRTVARRPVTVKVSVLKQDKDTYSSPMDIAVTCTIVVPYNLDPAQFLQALREKVPNVPPQFDLCRLVGQHRTFVALTSLCPSEIRQGNALGRSNLYIRPKGAAPPPPQSEPVSHPQPLPAHLGLFPKLKYEIKSVRTITKC